MAAGSSGPAGARSGGSGSGPAIGSNCFSTPGGFKGYSATSRPEAGMCRQISIALSHYVRLPRFIAGRIAVLIDVPHRGVRSVQIQHGESHIGKLLAEAPETAAVVIPNLDATRLFGRCVDRHTAMPDQRWIVNVVRRLINRAAMLVAPEPCGNRTLSVQQRMERVHQPRRIALPGTERLVVAEEDYLLFRRPRHLLHNPRSLRCCEPALVALQSFRFVGRIQCEDQPVRAFQRKPGAAFLAGKARIFA